MDALERLMGCSLDEAYEPLGAPTPLDSPTHFRASEIRGRLPHRAGRDR